jgi:hypothetical protein
MNEQERMAKGAGTHIWLHYATTVTVNGRPRTIEMGIPVPLGADDEVREQLLREANAGMNQLIGSVENRVAQLLQRVAPTQGAIPTPTPAAKPSVTPPPRPTTPSNPPMPTASSMPDVSAPPVTQQPASPYNTSQTSPSSQGREVREARETRETREIREPREPEKEQEREVAPSTSSANGPTGQPTQPLRQGVGVSLPSSGEIAKNFSLPQFIQYINEHLGLTPKQAMEILKVKSLSGINLRDALEQLLHAQSGADRGETTSDEGSERVVDKGRTGTTDPSMKAISGVNGQRAERAERIERVGSGERSDERPSKPDAHGTSTSKQPIPFRPATTKAEEPRANAKMLREPPAYFDEEDDERDEDIEDELDELLDDGDEDEPHSLTPQERVQASSLVSRLRESQGVAAVSPMRLKVLSNVIGDQLTEMQLADIVEGVWGIPSTKRLKVDQAEALISWAKEDDFQNEAEIVLMFLEEDALARGNR